MKNNIYIKKMIVIGTSLLCFSLSLAKNEARIRNETNNQIEWHMKTTGDDQNGKIDPNKEHTFSTYDIMELLTITVKDIQNGKTVKKVEKHFDIPWTKAAKSWNFVITGDPLKSSWDIKEQEKKLYEILIGNNTKRTLSYELKTQVLGKKQKGKIEPNELKYFYTDYLLDRLEISFTKKTGNKETEEQRGYFIPRDKSGKDWIFSVDGEPFKGPWSVCGTWAHTKTQNEATLAAEIIGITAGAVALGAGAGAAAGGAISGAAWASAAAAESAFTMAELAAGAVAATPTLSVTGAQVVGATVGATAGATAGSGTAAGISKAFGLSRKMHKDKCEWYGK